MSLEVILQGKASSTVTNLGVLEGEPGDTLLDYLIKKKIAIAYSCKGEGVCQKCKINDNELACQIQINDLKSDLKAFKVTIDYL